MCSEANPHTDWRKTQGHSEEEEDKRSREARLRT